MAFRRRRRERDAPAEEQAESPGALSAGIRAYHRATCHDFQRYAAGPGYLDWDSQPEPFRWFEGAPQVALPHAPEDVGATYAQALRRGSCEPTPLTLASVASCFEYALGLSAWKEYEDARWALRVDPSSGNLHPTEGYAVLPALEGLSEGATLVHYRPREHALELRARVPAETWSALAGELPPGSFLVVLSSIPWREAWKYGERAFRYCQHDVGHALACVALSAGALGWEARLIEGWGSDALDALLGVAQADGEEPELADCVLAITPRVLEGALAPPGPVALEHLGRPNLLSSEHAHWRAVELAARCTRHPIAERSEPFERAPAIALDEAPPTPFRALARQRRSAVAMDGRTSIARETFYGMLARTCATADARPFTALPWSPRVSLGLFVHRVEDLEPGFYALCRGRDHRARLGAAMRPEFLWELVPDAPAGLELYCLAQADVRQLAAALSCQQEIAGAGAFSLGMLADFDASIERGAWTYPELYWECGAIGQVLYLEAEAAGVRATGIGCYFDQPVHATFGLRDAAFQSLYHFTVGGPVDDARLTTRAPYPAP